MGDADLLLQLGNDRIDHEAVNHQGAAETLQDLACHRRGLRSHQVVGRHPRRGQPEEGPLGVGLRSHHAPAGLVDVKHVFGQCFGTESFPRGLQVLRQGCVLIPEGL